MKHNVEQNSQRPTLERPRGRLATFVLYQRKNNSLLNVTAAPAHNLHSFYRSIKA
ncbi:hypothetical protein SAMN05216403_11049 [Nitrosospira multiformis ATCC 25196]|uniref:Uncharacterized protein n=1 Tax=Nitrosospira multiformis (strain ATCC 25196 / NCIMB 11849 / C 71) TaxID=323848 RepID=A0A1H5V2Q0_NITMU|nr:hypothetical protein SAMN05216403_11049 [Nitrosospira multiformis ATCC 25196]